MNLHIQATPQDRPLARRAATLGAVVLVHVALLALLSATGNLPPVLAPILPAHLILASPKPPPPPPRLPEPKLAAPPAAFVPVPELQIAAPPPRAPQAITRSTPTAPPANHFGAATDAGLGLDVAAASGGGAGTRGSLAGFEAAVRARVLAGKRQPTLAWDRRNTCVVNYRVTVTSAGTLADFSIDPCAIPEINEAARTAIRHAAPFPRPPDLGAATAEVHGTLIFHP
jgi:protein TonB